MSRKNWMIFFGAIAVGYFASNTLRTYPLARQAYAFGAARKNSLTATV